MMVSSALMSGGRSDIMIHFESQILRGSQAVSSFHAIEDP